MTITPDEQSSSSLSTRSRSNSESQFKSTRAEKRMGRLFKQTSSASTTSVGKPSTSPTPTATTTLPAAGSGSGSGSTNASTNTNQKSDKQLDLEELKFHVGRNIRSMSQSAVTSQSSATTSSSENGSNSINATSHSSSSSVASTSSLSQGISLPRSSSLSQFTNYNGTPTQFKIPFSVQQQQPQYDNSNGVSSSTTKLTTLRETPTPMATPTNPTTLDQDTTQGYDILDLTTLLKLSNKFKFIYSEFTNTMQRLKLDSLLISSSYSNFVTVFETVDRKFSDDDKENVNEYFRSHLLWLMVDTMLDLKRTVSHISNLPLDATSNMTPEAIRMSYFSLFSLMVELMKMCTIIDPAYNLKSQLDQSKQNTILPSKPISTLPSRSHSQVQLSQPPTGFSATKSKSTATIPKVARVPAPNPHQPAQSISISTRAAPITSSAASIQRQPLKIDTSINPIARQDSEMSMMSATTESFYLNAAQGGDEKIFDLINYTAQAAQIVFSQLNNAISKSAIASAQNSLASSQREENTESNSDPQQQQQQQQPELTKMAQKVKELTTQCVVSMEQTKRIKTVLTAVRSSANVDEEQQKKLYEETNLFLKSIISILAATKSAIQDMPALNEVRGALSNLTRATKELTIKLETSSLKQSVTNASSTVIEQPPLSSIPSMANFQNSAGPSTGSGSTQHFFPLENGSNPGPTANGMISSNPASSLHNIVTNNNNTKSNNNINNGSSSLVTGGGSTTTNLGTKSQINPLEFTSIKQHINSLQSIGSPPPPPPQPQLTSSMSAPSTSTSTSTPTPTNVTVTTPLVATIGTAAASLVLPNTPSLNVSSGLGVGFSSVANSNNHNGPSITRSTSAGAGGNVGGGNVTGGESMVESNPFDKMILHNSLLAGATTTAASTPTTSTESPR
ncbi:hypothetical protein CANARDRAFT_27702 [[Candida] arabinofermentans NRRL YB-2248]|uniref:Uncharacterized protein n=1 Tax=[Candida] arabinofermentans NRRL YB-2248 TaxID=983967 RepID=A0A1E4T412_9ASCO|nr:hypothetical protein CANARDRAFT_27702 [[Candida] arabinofermentans NRRL YB-2248]